jgi:hypothetical protein
MHFALALKLIEQVALFDWLNSCYFLVIRRTPVKIRSPPIEISGVMVSPTKAVANKTVTSGSAKRKELVTAAFTLFITWNQIKYPMNEHVTARYRIAPHAWRLNVSIPRREFSAKENGTKKSPPIMFTYATTRKGLYFSVNLFPPRVYDAQRIGVSRRIKLPRRNVGLLLLKSIVPPVMTTKVPIPATASPKNCFLVKASLKIRIENKAMSMGERKQTKIEATEAPAKSMPTHWAIKKKVTPTRDRPTNVRTSLPSKTTELSGLLTFRAKRAAKNSAPATRNLNVAIAIGVNPCKSNAFTTTNELPQKIIRHSIKKKSSDPIFLLAIFPPLRNRVADSRGKI